MKIANGFWDNKDKDDCEGCKKRMVCKHWESMMNVKFPEGCGTLIFKCHNREEEG